MHTFSFAGHFRTSASASVIQAIGDVPRMSNPIPRLKTFTHALPSRCMVKPQNLQRKDSSLNGSLVKIRRRIGEGDPPRTGVAPGLNGFQADFAISFFCTHTQMGMNIRRMTTPRTAGT